MKDHLVLAACLVLAGCATQQKPNYEMVTNFTPDCRNVDAQVRYLSKMKRFDSQGDVSNKKFNTTIDIQIERLYFYCRNHHED
jgi:outer membrane murein-binding lipoprotein Lpp